MTFRMRRLPVLLALVTVAAVASPGQAAAPFTYTDPAGDAKGGSSGLDIVSVTYATTGRGAGRGYVPEQLVVTVRTAAPIVNAPGVTYSLQSEVVRCGYTAFTYSAQTLAAGRVYTQCGLPPGTDPGTVKVVTVDVEVGTDTIAFVVPFELLDGTFGPGDVMRHFETHTEVTDPVFALYGTGHLTDYGADTRFDSAASFGRWRIG